MVMVMILIYARRPDFTESIILKERKILQVTFGVECGSLIVKDMYSKLLSAQVLPAVNSELLMVYGLVGLQ